ncbi:MAG: hypothetical protein L3J03_09910 [Desulfobacterales bacterium]|nr:hypothetical protein [Desulfobacterales bacterium]
MTKKRLNTKEASDYLTNVEGVRVTSGTLEVWRSIKKGPEYRKVHNRVFYEVPVLQQFAAGRLCKTVG